MRSSWVSNRLAGVFVRGRVTKKFGKNTWLGIDVDRASGLFRYDVVAHRKTATSSFASGFGPEERIEYLHLRSNSHAVVMDAVFDIITEIFRCGPVSARALRQSQQHVE